MTSLSDQKDHLHRTVNTAHCDPNWVPLWHKHIYGFCKQLNQPHMHGKSLHPHVLPKHLAPSGSPQAHALFVTKDVPKGV